MKKLILLIPGVLASILGYTQNINDAPLDSLLQEEAGNFLSNPVHVGLTIGILYKGKTRTYHTGTTEKAEQQLPDDNTLYEIGSITKTITGALLAQAVVDKKVNLDDDVRKYLRGDYPGLEYHGNPVRLVHLLNHSSGLPFMLPDHPELFEHPDYDTLPFILSSLEKNYSREQFFSDLKEVKIDTIPGIKLRYSNAAAQLLGYILEDIYGKSYEELVRQYVCKPAGMKHTTLTVADKKNLAKGYNARGMLMPHAHSGAAGGIYSTIGDMLRYAQFQLDESNPVVSLGHQPTWGNIQYYAMGLNWQMMDKTDSPRKIFQSGGTAGFSSFMILYPELDTAVILLTNESDQDTQGVLSQMADKIAGNLKEAVPGR